MARMTAQAVWEAAQQGAATSGFVATSPLLAAVGGRYFVDCNEAGVGERISTAIAAHAPDPKEADRLRQVSGEPLRG